MKSALAIVFLLNSIALFVFPAIGHLLHLSQEQFGL
ncbi:putative sulfate exporter family transporter [Polaribacter sp. ALD11]|nr:putative sulfate exporter family transporter [Polaribacter sp. ALD11]